MGRYLTERDGDTLLHDLEQAARQRPWAVIAGGLTAGFIASRLLKTSSSDRYHRSQNGSGGSMPSHAPTSGARTVGTPRTATASPLDDLAERAERIPPMPPGGAPSTGSTGTAGGMRESSQPITTGPRTTGQGGTTGGYGNAA